MTFISTGVFTNYYDSEHLSIFGCMIGDLSTVATNVLDTVGDVASAIVSNPFLLLTTGVLFLGAAVGILGRMLSKS